MRGDWRTTESPEVRAELFDLGVLMARCAPWICEVRGFTDRRLQYGDLGQRRDGGKYAHAFGMIQRPGPI